MTPESPPGPSTEPLIEEAPLSRDRPPIVKEDPKDCVLATPVRESTFGERRVSFRRAETVSNAIYNAWRGHVYTFVFWLVISIAALIVAPFSSSLSIGEAAIVSLGIWMGLVGSGLYFLPIPLKSRPRQVKLLAGVILIFSVFSFVIDFPVFAGIVWSIKNADESSSESKDRVLAATACLMMLHGCFSVVTFAKCMIITTYDIPPGDELFL